MVILLSHCVGLQNCGVGIDVCLLVCCIVWYSVDSDYGV